MQLNSDDFHYHDFCPRFRTWDARYAPYRLPLSVVLSESLQTAIAGSDSALAYEKFMSLAANPGLDRTADNLYQVAIHHARLVEVVSAYILSVETLASAGAIEASWGEFRPSSFLLPDGRLRRVVIADRWDEQRENLERFSWRTAADTAITGRSMLITAILVGQAPGGFRSSPWTSGFKHPVNGNIRVQRRFGKFGEAWEKVRREETDIKPMEWLGIMQSDEAFEGKVISIEQDVPANRKEVLAQMELMASEMKASSLRQNRTSCFRMRPCAFAPACLSCKTPRETGWRERTV